MFSARILALLLGCLLATGAVAQEELSLDITTATDQQRLFIYSAQELHLIAVDEEKGAPALVLFFLSPEGEETGREVLFTGSRDGRMLGLNGISTGNGYLISFWQIDGDGQISLMVTGVETKKQPVGGVGVAAGNLVDAATRTMATLNNDSAGADLWDETGETTLYAIDGFDPDAKKRSYNLMAAISVNESGDDRQLRVFGTAFKVKTKSNTKIKKPKTREITAEIGAPADAVPTGKGRAAALGQTAFYLLGTRHDDDDLTRHYRARVQFTRPSKAPKNTDSSYGRVLTFQNVTDRFGGFATNRSRGFYLLIRYEDKPDGHLPMNMLGFEFNQQGEHNRRRFIAIPRPQLPGLEIADAVYNYHHQDLVMISGNRFLSTGFTSAEAIDGSAAADTVVAGLWTLGLDAPQGQELYQNTISDGRRVQSISLARLNDVSSIYLLVTWKQDGSAGYGMDLVVIEPELD